jgi:hypothetical protein
MEQPHRHAGTALARWFAREAGLANNTVAAGWIEMLDLLCVGTSGAWDASKRVEVARSGEVPICQSAGGHGLVA